jgi:3-oxoacyl-[acyl-carrier-protein] synthase-3
MSPAPAITGLGTVLPSRVVTNDELTRKFCLPEDWIRSRTGIGQRFWSDGMSTSDLAVEAGRRALESAGTGTVDCVVLATTTPDHPCPATAPDVAARLGLSVPAFDVGAVCSGFIYGLAAAGGLVTAGTARSALVIGAETYSTILDPDDPTTSVIFGDGAGAVVLRAGDEAEAGALLGFDLGSDGAQKDLITVPAGGSRQRTAQGQPPQMSSYFTMSGRAVFQQAINRMAGSVSAVLDRVGWAPETVSRLVAHQANVRILNAVADELGISRDRVVVDLDRVGNTSAASIPLALARASRAGQLAPGDRIVLAAFGGGLTWGATALVWPELTALSG